MAQRSQTEMDETNIAVAAAAGSVLLSWYQFYLRDNRTTGIFVGMWPPTILAFATYFKQRKTERELSDSQMGRIRDSIERMVES